MAKKSMGFAAAAKSVQRKEGVSAESARKIIAAGARKASGAAQRKNPALLKVSGVKRKK